MDRKTSLHVYIILTVVSILLLLSNQLVYVQFLKNITIRVLYPLSYAIDYPRVKYGLVNEKLALLLSAYEKNLKLNKDIKYYQEKCLFTQQLQKENGQLRDLLAIKDQANYSLMPVKVLVQNQEQYYSALVINKGSESGITRDMTVVVRGSGKWVLAGRVESVLPANSRVVLVTSPDFRCAADINGKRGVLEGSGNWELKLEYISPDAAVLPGDSVCTSGTGGIFPSGILIGYIDGIEELEFSKGKNATVRPALYPQNFMYLYVLKSNPE